MKRGPMISSASTAMAIRIRVRLRRFSAGILGGVRMFTGAVLTSRSQLYAKPRTCRCQQLAGGRCAPGGQGVQRVDGLGEVLRLDQGHGVLAGGAGLVAVLFRDQEHRRPGLGGGGHFVGDAPDRADGAVAADGTGAGHELAAVEVAVVEFVDDGQAEHQPRRRPANIGQVEVDGERRPRGGLHGDAEEAVVAVAVAAPKLAAVPHLSEKKLWDLHLKKLANEIYNTLPKDGEYQDRVNQARDRAVKIVRDMKSRGEPAPAYYLKK